MIEYVKPAEDMANFFAHPEVNHGRTRTWKKPKGQRHWFAVDHDLKLNETRDLLRRLPIGAYVVSFDWKYDSPSDPGAYVELQRYPGIWTAEFWNNGGWCTYKVPIDFESAARLYWDGLLVDTLHFMGYQSNREPELPTEHMAQSGLSHDLPNDFEERIKPEIVEHIKCRAAQIDGTSRAPVNPHIEAR